MFSGKSEELIRRVTRSRIARLPVQAFKPALDVRYAETRVVEVRETSKGDRGIVTVETKGINQRGEEVCYFRRKVMVWKKEAGPARQRPYGDEIWTS